MPEPGYVKIAALARAMNEDESVESSDVADAVRTMLADFEAGSSRYGPALVFIAEETGAA